MRTGLNSTTLPHGYLRWIKAAALVIFWAFVLTPSPVRADSESEETQEKPRKFNDVLTELLNEFSYDLKTSQVKGVQNVAVRRVAVSESIPKSYESYLESLVLERLRLHSSLRVIQCTQCRVKRSVIENGRVVISLPINNPAELDRISAELSIETWLDVALLYQETNMILALNAFDAKTKELVWTKVYNSESMQRKKIPTGTGPQPPEEAEAEDKEPPSQFSVSLTTGWIMVPNVKTPSNMLGFNFRVAEQFNEKRSEVGAMLVPIVDPGLFISEYGGVEGDPEATGEVKLDDRTESIKPFSWGLGIYATYHHNFIKLPENYDVIRYGMHIGLGGIYAPGYLTFTGRTGGLLKFGKHFILEGAVLYSAPTTINVLDRFEYRTKGGVGSELTFGLVF